MSLIPILVKGQEPKNKAVVVVVVKVIVIVIFNYVFISNMSSNLYTVLVIK